MLARLLVVCAAVTLFDAQGSPRVPAENASDVGSRLLQDASVRSAIDQLKRDEPQLLDEQMRICETAAPPFKEARRAEVLRQSFESIGLQNVRIDRAGNVLGER